MENNHNPMEDDGSLDFLKIPATGNDAGIWNAVLLGVMDV